MISSFFFVLGLFKELLLIIAPVASYVSLLKFNRIRYFINAIGLILIATNITTSAGLLINQSGQDLVLITSLILFASILKSIITNRNQAINKAALLNFAFVITIIFILPSLSFFFNSPDLSSDYIFWLKRTLLVLFIVLLGCFSSVVSPYSIRIIVVVVFIFNCVGVITSFFVPELFTLFIDADDPMLEKGLNPMGGGFFLNPNGAALSVVFSYLALFYIRYSIDRTWFVLFSFLFVVTLSITGSRGGFLCGVLILVLSAKELTNFVKLDFKGFVILVAALSATIGIMMNLTGGESLGGFSRIVEFNNEGNLASNDSRLNALVSSLNLAFDAPFIGVGFGLRNKLLDTQPHNMYAAYAVDIGIVGLLAFPVFIIILTKKIFCGRGKINYRVTVFAILLMGLFDHEIIYSKQFAYLLFVAFAVSKFGMNRSRESLKFYQERYSGA
jgi:hypothetical protein